MRMRLPHRACANRIEDSAVRRMGESADALPPARCMGAGLAVRGPSDCGREIGNEIADATAWIRTHDAPRPKLNEIAQRKNACM